MDPTLLPPVPARGRDLPAGGGDPVAAAEVVIAAFLRGRRPATLRTYAASLDAFAAYCGQTRGEAVACLIQSDAAEAHAFVLGWQEALVAAGLAPATVNVRLSAVRALVRLAHSLGKVAWTLDVRGVAAERYRDTRGPGKDAVRAMIWRAAARGGARGARDRALLLLLYVLGLRRHEATGLDVEHFDPTAAQLRILGKGQGTRQALSLPPVVVAALRAWLEHRGMAPGPLFVGLGPGARGGMRMDGSTVYRIVRAYGEAVGKKVRPHGVRHTAITEALEQSGGNVRKAQKFSRHANVQTVLIYDDARQDLAGEVAAGLGAELLDVVGSGGDGDVG